MNRFLLSFFAFVALIFLPSVVSSKELIREFNGSESSVTADFEVEGPWMQIGVPMATTPVKWPWT